MNAFLNITPQSHDEALRQTHGKLYIIYFSKDCVFCRQAIMNLINMPENTLFTYAVCQVDGFEDLSFSGIDGRELLFLLDAKYGVSASGGSACSASSSEPSHVLTAMGLTKEEAESAVRISLGPENTMDDAAYIVKAIKESVEYLRNR